MLSRNIKSLFMIDEKKIELFIFNYLPIKKAEHIFTK